jgi:hypothetical protein
LSEHDRQAITGIIESKYRIRLTQDQAREDVKAVAEKLGMNRASSIALSSWRCRNVSAATSCCTKRRSSRLRSSVPRLRGVMRGWLPRQAVTVDHEVPGNLRLHVDLTCKAGHR